MELINQNNTSPKKVNIKKVILGYLKFWPWILISIGIFYLVAFLYLRYTQPQYLSTTTLMFQQSNNGKMVLSDLQNLGIGVGDNGLEGESAILTSKPLLRKVGQQLNLGISFFVEGKVRDLELYKISPFSGTILYHNKNFTSATYNLEPNKNGTFRLTDGPLLGNKNTFNYGQEVHLPWGKVVITRNINYRKLKVKVVFRNDSNIESFLESGIKTQIKPGLLMDITFTGAIPQKSVDILNELSKQYNIEGLNDKNIEAENTSKFINERLKLIAEDLGKIELDKENFKKANKVTDIDVQANIAVNRLTGNIGNYFDLSAKLEILNELYTMAVSEKDKLFPTGLGMPAATESLLNQYNNMLLLKKRTLTQATQVNPSIKAFDKELFELLNSVRNNLQDNRAQIQRQIGQTNTEMGEDKASIYKYPTQERIFHDIERQRTLKESLYLYLLQKREENAIAKAVTAPKAKVVNPAYTTGLVQPNYNQIKFGALGLGLIFPLLIIYLLGLLDTKVRTKQDIDDVIPQVSVIGEIPINLAENPLVQKNDFTVFAEAFRILISNIKFILRSQNINKGGVILITSSVKGEGKTTISFNTAISLSGSARVLLIGADIRNPQLHRYLPKNSKNSKGLTDYLVSDSNTADEFIVNSGLDPNFDILFSGAKAPNPNDLLDMQKFDEMILELKNKYDYIIMDSAPIMLVSDSLHLLDISDLVIYTVKSEFTEREMLSFAHNFKKDNNVKNMVFVLNNVKPEYSKYGSKYGYGYYSNLEPQSKIRNLFKNKDNIS